MAQNPIRVTRRDVKGVWAIMPTPSKPNAGDRLAQDTVDHDEAARVVEALIAAGVDGILTLGTFGECATLTWAEKRSFMRVCAETARGRVPVFGGTTTLNTRETIAQTRELPGLGISGTMLGLPMWVRCDLPTAVRFYRDVAEYCPDTAICLYANTQAFKFDYSTAFWEQVATIETIVGAKYLSIARMGEDLAAVGGAFPLLTNEVDYCQAARLYPDSVDGFWSSGAVNGPSTVIALRDAAARARIDGDWSEAQAIADAIKDAETGFFPNGDFAEFSKYNIGLEKGRMDAAGWIKAGPMRPPYCEVPAEFLAAAQRSGRKWAALHQRFGKEAVASAAE